MSMKRVDGHCVVIKIHDACRISIPYELDLFFMTFFGTPLTLM
jgi:hypothetical protein